MSKSETGEKQSEMITDPIEQLDKLMGVRTEHTLKLSKTLDNENNENPLNAEELVSKLLENLEPTIDSTSEAILFITKNEFASDKKDRVDIAVREITESKELIDKVFEKLNEEDIINIITEDNRNTISRLENMKNKLMNENNEMIRKIASDADADADADALGSTETATATGEQRHLQRQGQGAADRESTPGNTGETPVQPQGSEQKQDQPKATIVTVTADGNTENGTINIVIKRNNGSYTFYGLHTEPISKTVGTNHVTRKVNVLKKENGHVTVDKKNQAVDIDVPESYGNLVFVAVPGEITENDIFGSNSGISTQKSKTEDRETTDLAASGAESGSASGSASEAASGAASGEASAEEFLGEQEPTEQQLVEFERASENA